MLEQIISTVVGFFLLVVLLRSFFWKSILALLDERKRRVEEGLKKIDQMQHSLDAAKQDYDKRLAGIEAKARETIQESVLEGKKIAREMQDEARSQASAILAKSQESAALEIAKAKVELRNDLANIALAAVEKLLKQKVDASTDRRLVDEAIKELERSPK